MGLIKLAKKRQYTMKELKEHRIEMTKAELDEVFKRKAVWHHGINGEETPAVWKSHDVARSVEEAGNTKTPIRHDLYITNTHRAMAVSPTLKGAINKYHSFIKGTA